MTWKTRSSRVNQFHYDCSRQGQEISLSESTQTNSEVHSASYSAGIGDAFLEGKRPERGARPSPPPSDGEVRNAWSRISTSLYVSVMCCLIKHRDNFISTFYQLYQVRSQMLFWLSTNFQISYRSRVGNPWPALPFLAVC